MKIYAKKKFDNNDEYYNRLPLPSQVKRIGDYLAKNKDKDKRFIDVKKVVEHPNQYLIYLTVMYEMDAEAREMLRKTQEMLEHYKNDDVSNIMKKGTFLNIMDADEVYTADIMINIVTYGQYIRVYFVLYDRGREPNLGYTRLDKQDLMSLPACKEKLMRFVKEKIIKYYANRHYDATV